jgi:hypothetical protein
LMILFSLTENTSLLSLHGRQQNPIYKGENGPTVTGWIRALSRAIQTRVGEGGSCILDENEVHGGSRSDQTIIALGLKLDSLAKLLKLYPCNKKGSFKGILKPVSQKAIQPVHILCPDSAICETLSCQPRSLLQWTKARDVPMVRLIKNFTVHEQVPVLSGYCPECKTIYYADHEKTPSMQEGKHNKVYLNSAQYIKIGQNLWVDRLFTSGVLSGIYSFHASAATYATFWNTLFCDETKGKSAGNVTRRQIWQAFVQESIRLLAAEARTNLVLPGGLAIDEVTKEAFQTLGNNGVVRAAQEHSCEECTQKYRERAEVILHTDPSALVGMEDTGAEQGANISRVVNTENNNDDTSSYVKMVVVDGIVMGHTVSLAASKYWIFSQDFTALCI